MRAILITQGNPLRRDDGVAHHVFERLGSGRDVESRALLQLTPEVAADIAGFDIVIFIDADMLAADLSIDPLDRFWSSDQFSSFSIFTHDPSPTEIVELARSLFGFVGRAFVCRIPVADLSSGEELSPRAGALAEQAAGKLENLLGALRAECDGKI